MKKMKLHYFFIVIYQPRIKTKRNIKTKAKTKAKTSAKYKIKTKLKAKTKTKVKVMDEEKVGLGACETWSPILSVHSMARFSPDLWYNLFYARHVSPLSGSNRQNNNDNNVCLANAVAGIFLGLGDAKLWVVYLNENENEKEKEKENVNGKENYSDNKGMLFRTALLSRIMSMAHSHIHTSSARFFKCDFPFKGSTCTT
jgi:hypothetical protein